MEHVIKVTNIRKSYGAFTAVEDVSLMVKKGEIFGIVGPNGAGKTTTMNMIMGLRRPDSGQVEVLGLDPQQAGAELRQRIGVQLQEADLPEKAKVWEIMDTFASFYKRTVPWEPLLAEWGLSSKQNAYFGSLSGGQKQRVFIALALINDPELVFLDELTTGLDPQARRQTWELVRAVRDRGKTVVQVTHFMDEAEALCDRVAIINGGRVIALDTPKELIRQ
ncbi:MAG: ABC transporter ATP-binding protein, partial [Anaerolineales bacterium]|nr:ABC transporter ATP-binding protein [Anaerolineales bacterium]